mmetsp:Transcript_123001/g.274664  ORF Transcript_123001/g.274664 Transcript_123001/m.274664 type:complete len:397 (+) Transcript_123001:80-1270(+)
MMMSNAFKCALAVFTAVSLAVTADFGDGNKFADDSRRLTAYTTASGGAYGACNVNLPFTPSSNLFPSGNAPMCTTTSSTTTTTTTTVTTATTTTTTTSITATSTVTSTSTTTTTVTTATTTATTVTSTDTTTITTSTTTTSTVTTATTATSTVTSTTTTTTTITTTQGMCTTCPLWAVTNCATINAGQTCAPTIQTSPCIATTAISLTCPATASGPTPSTWASSAPNLYICRPCGFGAASVTAAYSEGTTGNTVDASVPFGPNTKYASGAWTIDEADITGYKYKIYNAFGEPVATGPLIPKTSAATSTTCCDTSKYSVTLTSEPIPDGSTYMEIVSVDTNGFELPVGIGGTITYPVNSTLADGQASAAGSYNYKSMMTTLLAALIAHMIVSGGKAY